MNVQEMVREFHEAFGVVICDRPAFSDEYTNELRLRLMREEWKELTDAIEDEAIVDVADALADLTYVIYGSALTWGIDLEAVIAEVHRSNMTKLGEDGKPLLREDGKVLKGPNYSPPNIESVLFP